MSAGGGPSTDSMYITVKTLTGLTFNLEVNSSSSDTIEEVNIKIQAAKGLPPKVQTLVSPTHERLEDSHTLSEYK